MIKKFDPADNSASIASVADQVRPVKIGEESEGMTIVSGGLALHEQVVTSNQYRLQAGTLVRSTAAGAPSAAAQPGAS